MKDGESTLFDKKQELIKNLETSFKASNYVKNKELYEEAMENAIKAINDVASTSNVTTDVKNVVNAFNTEKAKVAAILTDTEIEEKIEKEEGYLDNWVKNSCHVAIMDNAEKFGYFDELEEITTALAEAKENMKNRESYVATEFSTDESQTKSIQEEARTYFKDNGLRVAVQGLLDKYHDEAVDEAEEGAEADYKMLKDADYKALNVSLESKANASDIISVINTATTGLKDKKVALSEVQADWIYTFKYRVPNTDYAYAISGDTANDKIGGSTHNDKIKEALADEGNKYKDIAEIAKTLSDTEEALKAATKRVDAETIIENANVQLVKDMISFLNRTIEVLTNSDKESNPTNYYWTGTEQTFLALKAEMENEDATPKSLKEKFETALGDLSQFNN